MKIEPDVFHILVEHLDEGVYLVDTDRLITHWNPGAERISGYAADDVIGHHCFANILRHVDDQGTQLCFRGCPLKKTLDDGQDRESVVYLHHKDGRRIPVNVRSAAIRDGDGRVIGALEVFSETTAGVAALSRLTDSERLSLVDDVTGVANRRYSNMALEARIQEFKRYDWPFGLIFVDIDRFKRINDQYGHNHGDQVLRVVAGTIAANLRSHDFVGRWGGDEFIVLLTQIEPSRVVHIANRLGRLIATSGVSVAGKSSRATASLGVTVVRADDTLESIIERADKLMYRSKDRGRNATTSDLEALAEIEPIEATG